MKVIKQLFAAVAVLMLCPLVSQATIHHIDMSGLAFSPTGTVVTYGDTVRWHLVGGVHTTTSDLSSPKAWNSGTMSTAGQTFDVVFTAGDGSGPFPYHCSFHVSLNMVDTIRAIPPATGACCLPNGSCAEMTALTCVAEFGGAYQGDNTLCADTQCPTTCCTGTTGNVDGDLSDVVDISDLSAVVDYLFFGGSISSCFEENDVDTSSSIDISDLQALIDFLFFGASLPDCP